MVKATEMPIPQLKISFSREDVQNILMAYAKDNGFYKEGFTLVRMSDDCGHYRDDILQGIELEFTKSA